MLRAVPVIRRYVHDENALDVYFMIGNLDAWEPRYCFLPFEGLDMGKDLQACLAWVIDQNHGDPIIAQ